MYLRNVREGGVVTTMALITKDKNGMISIKLMGYDDIVKMRPSPGIKRDIEDVEMVEEEETKEIEKEVTT
jgi:hypothetical protein